MPQNWGREKKKSVGVGVAQDKLGLMTLTVDDNNGDTVDRFIVS